MALPLIAGIELGGTKTVCTLATGPDSVRHQVRIPTTTPEDTLSAVVACLNDWWATEPFAAIGVASFGPLDVDPTSPNYGTVVTTPKPGWTGADLLTPLRRFGVPIGFDTDVNGAALAEGLWGAARGLSAFAYVTVGTGIGVGSIVDGKPIRGLGHSEAGHLRVPRLVGHEDFPGQCPYHGDCVEGLASGPAIRARTGSSADALPPDHAGWAEPAHALAMLCHNLILTSLPQRILIGGGVAMGQAHLLPRIRGALVRSLKGYAHGADLAVRVDDVVITPGLGERAGPMGSIALGRAALT